MRALDNARITWLYVDAKRSISEIAVELGVAASTIRGRLKSLGIERRPPGRAAGHFQPTEHLLEVLDGLLLGDGSWANSSTGNTKVQSQFLTPYFAMYQSVTHAEWVSDVKDALEAAGLATNCRVVRERARPVLQLRTRAYVEFGPERLRWYRPAPCLTKLVKAIPFNLRLTPLVLAYWLFGRGARTVAADGSICGFEFRMRPFDRPDCERLIRRLQEAFAWEPRLTAGNTATNIILDRPGDCMALRTMVAPHTPRCFLSYLRS